VTAAVAPTSRRREAGNTATPGGGVTSDDDVDGHMTKTDTCYTLLCSDVSTPDTNLLDGRFCRFLHAAGENCGGIELKFHGSSFRAASSYYPCDILARILARMSLTCHKEIWRVGQGCYDYDYGYPRDDVGRVSARMPRGCHEETAPVEFQLCGRGEATATTPFLEVNVR